MRLNELFEQVILEDELDKKLAGSVQLSLADIYDMTGKNYPTKPGPNGNEITPPGFFDKATMQVGGEDGISIELAQAHEQWVAGGRLPGVIYDPLNKELRPYNDNNVLEDMSWQFAAGTAELASMWIKGAAVPIDDLINDFTTFGKVYKYVKGENLSNIKGQTLSGYEKGEAGKAFWADRVNEYFLSKTDQSFRDNMDFTSGAVDTFDDVGSLLSGNTGFNIEGVGGIMIGELPSEIVDMSAMILMGPLAGMATTGALNALEAGGAAAQSISDRINKAYENGVLQEQPQYKIAFDAAYMQLDSEGGRTHEEIAEEAADMARKHTIDASIRHAFYKVAVTGGVIDAVQNKILYKSNIGAGFLKTALVKGLAGTMGEGVSGALEQRFENLGIIDGAGNFVTANEGVINAAYNEMLASQGANVLATGADAAVRAKGAVAGLRRFVMGGSRDPKALIDIMGMDPNQLINGVTSVDPVTGVRKFSIAELMRKRLLTSDQLTDAQKKELKGGLFGSGGGKVTITNADGTTEEITQKQIDTNDANVELISLMDDIEINPNEATSTVNLNSEEEARRLAQLLGIKVNGESITNKTDINAVLLQLEDVRKIDVRVEGRSTLEPPIWSDLDQKQKMQYWKEGRVTFEGDPDRGNQIWTRQQVLYNSRRNGDTIPDNVASFADNAIAKPDINNEDYADTREEIQNLEQQIENSMLMRKAKEDLASDQSEWDEFAKENGTESTVSEFGPRPSRDMPNDPYNFNGAKASTTTLEAEVIRIKREIAQDKSAWEAEFGTTHFADGSAKKGTMIFDETAIANQRSDNMLIALSKAKEVAENGVVVTPHVPTNDAGNEEATATSRQNYIASAKMKIANGDMDPETLDGFLNQSDKFFPGISSEIISQEQRQNYTNVNQRPAVLDAVSMEVEKPTTIVANTRPPRGAVIEIEGKPYVWLGIEEGTGGMWAEQKADGSRGTTVHNMHEPLMTAWKDSTIDKSIPDALKPPTNADVIPNIEKQVELAQKNETLLLNMLDQQDNDTLDAMADAVSAPQGDGAGQDNNPNTDGGQARSTSQGSDNNPNTDGGQARSTSQGSDNNPNTDGGQSQTPTGQDNNPNAGDGGGASVSDEAREKAQARIKQVQDKRKAEVFDPSAETPIDAQFADVEVPQSVKDEYADVLATKNGIKVMQFLDGLPPEQAGSLRVNNAPEVTTTAQGDGAGQDNNPNRDGGQTRDNIPGSDNNPNTDGGQTRTTSTGQDNNPNTDGGQTRTTSTGQDNNPNTDGGQDSDIEAQAQARADKIKADAIAKQKADSKADADALNDLKTTADAQTATSDEKLIALGQQIAQAQTDAKADAQTATSDENLIALGQQIAQQKADAQNKISDEKLIALGQAYAQTQADAKADAQTATSDEKLIALGQAYAQAKADVASDADALDIDTTAQGDGAGQDNNPNQDGGQLVSPKKLTPRQKDAIAGRGEFSTTAPTVNTTGDFDTSVPSFEPLVNPKVTSEPTVKPTVKEPGVDDSGVNFDIVPEPVTKISTDAEAQAKADAEAQAKADAEADAQSVADLKTTTDPTSKVDTTVVIPPVVPTVTNKVTLNKNKNSQNNKNTVSKKDMVRKMGGGLGGDKEKKKGILPAYVPMKIKDPLKLDKYRSFGKDNPYK